MAIIGRLDRQVDEVLISPAGKRRREERPAPTAEPPPEPPVERRSELTSETAAGPADEIERRPRFGELPVWLL